MPMIITFIMPLVNKLIRLGWITWLANSYWNDPPCVTWNYYKTWQDRPAQPSRQMFICNAALRNKEMRANCSSSSACPANSSEEELPVGLEVYGNLELVFTVVSAVMTGLLMFSLGCSVEIRRLWSHIRRPWGIAVGLLCQFGLMPLTAYLLVISFSLKPVQAMAILIMGCCPGGTISNIFTYWVDGDMDLR